MSGFDGKVSRQRRLIGLAVATLVLVALLLYEVWDYTRDGSEPSEGAGSSTETSHWRRPVPTEAERCFDDVLVALHLEVQGQGEPWVDIQLRHGQKSAQAAAFRENLAEAHELTTRLGVDEGLRSIEENVRVHCASAAEINAAAPRALPLLFPAATDCEIAATDAYLAHFREGDAAVSRLTAEYGIDSLEYAAFLEAVRNRDADAVLADWGIYATVPVVEREIAVACGVERDWDSQDGADPAGEASSLSEPTSADDWPTVQATSLPEVGGEGDIGGFSCRPIVYYYASLLARDPDLVDDLNARRGGNSDFSAYMAESLKEAAADPLLGADPKSVANRVCAWDSQQR